VALDLGDIIARVRGGDGADLSRLTYADLSQKLEWVPRLQSRYFVQADGDVATLRDLVPELGAANVGIATNVDSMDARGSIDELVGLTLALGAPAYLDSGVYPRWRSGQPAPDFGRVCDRYVGVFESSPDPDLVAVTAPDRIGDPAATVQLQRRHGRVLRELIGRGARVVVPIQATSASGILSAIRDAEHRFDGCWIGIPVRKANTTPLEAIIVALLRLGCGSVGRTLPKLHLLGVGGSERISTYASRIAAIYRILSGPHLYSILLERRAGQDRLTRLLRRVRGDDYAVAAALLGASEAELAQLVGCVQARAYFPCPPGYYYTCGGGHPILNEYLATLWNERPDPNLVVPGHDRWTEEILGWTDRTVEWSEFMRNMGDYEDFGWHELCAEVVDAAEERDPCMVPGAWDADDLDRLVKGSGFGRIETDATTVPFAAGHGAWIVEGRQSKGTTPAWWKRRPSRFRFTWNLLATILDRAVREARFSYRYPTGYDERGFVVSQSGGRESRDPFIRRVLLS